MPFFRRALTGAAFLAAGLSLAACLLAPSPALAVQALRHDIEVAVSPAARSLHGTDLLTLRLDGEKSVEMELAPEAKILSVRADKRTLRYAFKDGVLRVDAPRSDGLVEIRVEYRIGYPDEPPANPLSADDPSYGVTGAIVERGVFLPDGALWKPTLPGPSIYRLEVTAPEGWLAVSEGRLVRHSTAGAVTSSVYDSVRPLDGLTLVVGPFERREAAAGSTPVSTYLYPDGAALAEPLLKTAADAVAFYSALHGPYAFPKFSVVENFFPTGYGFPSFTLLGSQVIRMPFVVATSLPHEVAHCWWGNGVLVDWSRGNWSEGLTSYVADYLSRERESAEAARDYRLQALRNYAAMAGGEEDFPLSRFKGRHSGATQAVGYGKALMVFHMARRLVGEEPFWEGLRDVYRDKLFQEASWDDFGEAFGKRANMDMGPFLAQWIDRAGAPVLTLENPSVREVLIPDDASGGTKRIGYEAIGVIRQLEPVYDLRLPVVVEAGGRRVEKIVEAREAVAPFAVFTEERPTRLLVDPDAHVFRRLSPQEIPPAVNSLRGSGAATVVVSDALMPEERQVAALLPLTLGLDEAPVLTEEQAAPEALAGRDVLFIGLPARDDLKPLLAPIQTTVQTTIQGDAKSFVAEDKTYADPGDALFAVARKPGEAERAVALYLPLSAEAAKASLRKIQHYGRYGLLTFRNGVNEVKKTAEVESALEAKF